MPEAEIPNPKNQETDPRYNVEPGIARTPGSPFLQEMSKFEQFHSSWTAGTPGPGNPYRYRPFPKMLYRAKHYNGKALCMAAPPDTYAFTDPRDYERALIAAEKFTNDCQCIVQNEEEYQRAMENNWRESPQEAVELLLAKDRAVGDATATRLWEDRNMSPQAQAEAEAAVAEAGGEHLPEIPEKRRRGRPRKVA